VWWGIRLTEVHTAEPLVPGPSLLEVEIATAKFRDHISAQWIQPRGETILRYINSLTFGIIPNNIFIKYPSMTVKAKLLGIISVGFDVTDQLLIRFSVPTKCFS
jgi:hypothetical protein